jgi:hypothetical protein
VKNTGIVAVVTDEKLAVPETVLAVTVIDEAVISVTWAVTSVDFAWALQKIIL